MHCRRRPQPTRRACRLEAHALRLPHTCGRPQCLPRTAPTTPESPPPTTNTPSRPHAHVSHCAGAMPAISISETLRRQRGLRPALEFAASRGQPKTNGEFPHPTNQCGSGGGLRPKHRHTFSPMRDHLQNMAIRRKGVTSVRTAPLVRLRLQWQPIPPATRFHPFLADELEGPRLGD